ncbi:MAG: imidazole glycerol phosphate synthase subunit HisH [Candidatus Latescibacteria bacterium]|nr:imidazole glycerol phosphate synthase subunit HisH [Candidatus Latescibacterota bacterium]
MITIIDYGMGNLRSVQKAFERGGHPATITNRAEEVAQATRLVLPGVGAFGEAMDNLRKGALIAPLLNAVGKGVPLLGICLGQQLLFSRSEEMGDHAGLGLLPGRVRRFPPSLRVPHIGWNQAHIQRPSPLLKGIPDHAFFYFVHSYYVDPADPTDTLTTTDYGIDYASIVGRDRLFGIQFHPEKSQDLGLRLLKNFAEMM